MTRSSHRPPGQVQPDKPATPGPVQAAPAQASPTAAPGAPSSGLKLGWRVALLVWLAAFIVLMLLEVGQSLVKALRQAF